MLAQVQFRLGTAFYNGGSYQQAPIGCFLPNDEYRISFKNSLDSTYLRIFSDSTIYSVKSKNGSQINVKYEGISESLTFTNYIQDSSSLNFETILLSSNSEREYYINEIQMISEDSTYL